MPRALRIIPALGAVLFALVGLSACGGIPGDAVVSVDGNSITKDTFNHWMSVAGGIERARRPAANRRSRCRRTTRPASPPRKPPRNRPKGRRAPTEAALKIAVRAAVQIAAAGGARLPHLLQLGDRRSEVAGREDLRQGSQEAVRKNQEPAVPEGGRIRKIPENVGPERVRPAAAREAEPALAENPAEDRQTEVESHAGADRQVLQRKPETLRRRRKAQPADHPHQDRSAGEEGQAGNRIGQELRKRRQARVDRPDEQVQRRQARGRRQRPGGEVARRGRLLGQEERARRDRSRRRSATTSSRSRRSRRAASSRSSRPKRRSSRSSRPRSSSRR